MRCPKCGGTTKTYDSRPRDNGRTVWRRRRCVECFEEETTIELALVDSVRLRKR